MNTSFRRLWLGQSVSLVGSQVAQLAIPLIAVVQLHASVAEIGLLTLLRYVPFVLLSLPAGHWVDRWSRRPVLIVTNLARSALVGVVALMAATGRLHMADLYVVSVASGVLSLIFVVAFRSVIPALVAPDDMVAAQSKLSGGETVASIVGPGLGGLLIAVASAPFALLVDAATFVVAAVAASGIAERGLVDGIAGPADAAAPVKDTKGGAFEGLRTIAAHPLLRALAFEGAIANLCGTMLATLFLVFAVRALSLGPIAIGVALSAGGVGALGGAAAAGPFGVRLGPGRLCVLALAVTDVTLLVVPAVHGDSAVVVVLLAALFALGSLATTVYEIHTSALVYAATPAGQHGRIQAGLRFVGSFGLVGGPLLAGILSQLLGLRAALLVAAVVGLLHWPVLLRSPLVRSPLVRSPLVRSPLDCDAGDVNEGVSPVLEMAERSSV